MTRLAAQEKGEFYPTPLEIVDLVLGHLALDLTKKGGLVRLLDPCAGTGQPLQRLAAGLRARYPLEQRDVAIQTWGVELHEERAAEAATRLDVLVNAPFETVNWTPRQYGVADILFLNPPYDFSEDSGRMETWFLRQASDALVKDGLLIYLVPPAALTWETGELLYTRYDRVQLYRFPDPWYAAFKQVVILGRKRPQTLTYWSVAEEIQEFQRYAPQAAAWMRPLDPRTLPPLPGAPETRYVVPLVGTHRAELRRTEWLAEEVVARLTLPPEPLTWQETGPLEVLEDPKRGHLAQLVASGLLDTVTLADGEVIKGRSVPVIERTEEDDGETETVTEITRWAASIVRVTRNGAEWLQGATALPFLETNADRLARLLRGRLQPYGNHAQPGEQAILDTLSQDRPRPDGTGDCGLYPDQRKTVIAALRAIARHGVAHAVCEMGYGKTTVGSAVIATGDYYPALIVCPPTLLDKWAREAQQIIPGAQVVTALRLGELQAALAAYRPGDKLIVITSRTMAKMGPGWDKAAATRYALPATRDSREVAAALRAPFRDAVAAYQAARATLPGGPLPPPRPWPFTTPETSTALTGLRRAALAHAQAVPVCPECGQPVGEHYRRATPATCNHRTETENDGATLCPAPLYEYQPKVSRRWPLASYIQRQAKGFFRLLIVDEVHEDKAEESDQGEAFGRLAQAIPHVLTLTGTFYGGVSSSIFYLLFRAQRDIRREWKIGDKERWIVTYGRLMKTYKTSVGSSAHNARAKTRVNIKEIPGIAPGVLRHILHTVIFRSIKDLGVQLPPFYDEVVALPMSPALAVDVQRVEAYTWEQVREHRNRYLSSWLQWTLSRPNSAFREEVVRPLDAATEPLVAPAVVSGDALLPKEQWLVNTAQQELAEGRRVLVYLRQTGTRDIRQRLVTVLQRAGVNAEVLPDGLEPRKREAWLNAHQPAVLLVNPRKVATGLDLVQYQTVVFFEIEYSLYVVWQACRRVWRLGQHQPVRCYYLVYQETMEERAIRLIGQKMTAAQLLYGDDVAGALVDDSVDDEASLVMALMQSIEADEQLAAVGHLFGSDEAYTQSPVGVPTKQSPRLTIVELLAQQGQTLDDLRRAQRRRRAPRAPAALPPGVVQAGLFDSA